MSAIRSELGQSLHRLANSLEAQLPDLFRDLLVEQGTATAQSIANHMIDLIDNLREARDGEGGAV